MCSVDKSFLLFIMFSKKAILEESLNLFRGKKKVYQFKSKGIILKLIYKDLYISFAWRGWFFEKRYFKALNLTFENVIKAGRHECCGMENRTVVPYGCWKTKKLICGMEEENVVARGTRSHTKWIPLKIVRLKGGSCL